MSYTRTGRPPSFKLVYIILCLLYLVSHVMASSDSTVATGIWALPEVVHVSEFPHICLHTGVGY